MTRTITIRLRSEDRPHAYDDQAFYEFKFDGELADFLPTFEEFLRAIGVPESELTEVSA